MSQPSHLTLESLLPTHLLPTSIPHVCFLAPLEEAHNKDNA